MPEEQTAAEPKAPTPEEMVAKIQRALEEPTTHAATRGALKKRLAEFEAQIGKKAAAEDPAIELLDSIIVSPSGTYVSFPEREDVPADPTAEPEPKSKRGRKKKPSSG
jgi:hypothetical protein